MSRGHSNFEGADPALLLVAENEEAEDEAFIDLDDPNNEILNEEGMQDMDNTSDNEEDGDVVSSRADPHTRALASHACAHRNADDDNEEEEAALSPADLNEIPDREPERDDALCHYIARESKALHCIDVHPMDPHLFATGGEGDEAYILRLHEGPNSTAHVEELSVLRGHTDTVGAVAFSPDGKWLATGGLDSVVCVWSTATWECVHSLRDLYGEILTLLWHPSSLVLVAGAEDAQAAMWNISRGTLSSYFVGHRGPVTCAVWSPDHKKLVTGSGDGSVIVFAPKTGEQEFAVARGLSPDTASVTALCFVSDDQCIVGCEDGSMHIVSLRVARAVRSLEDVHDQAIESLCVNPRAALMLSASCDCRVAVWNTTDMSLRVVLRLGESVIPAVWTRGHCIVAGCSDGEVRVWDGRAMEQEPLAQMIGHRRMVIDLTVSESIVATASDDGTARFFRLPEVDP